MSQFLKYTDDYLPEQQAGIDFDAAVKLPGGGTTCDIYRTRWQRREVFVKRLKEEYRAKPLYLDALDKEFDIGVSLKHPSLPEYREFHRDYVIIDFIDGLTLAEMIRRHDSWLMSERHIVRLFRELVEVVGYLHRRNVVHCDIKPDNIMITANTGNLILIDFDKCNTDSLGDTAGHPGRYGLSADNVGRQAVDFRAIGMLAERLRSDVPGFRFRQYAGFVKACYNPDVSCEELSAILDAGRQSRRRMLSIIGTALIVGLGGYYFIHTRDDSVASVAQPSVEVLSPPVPVPRTQDELFAIAKRQAEALDARIQPCFDELHAGLDRLIALKSDSTATAKYLLESIRRHADKEDEYYTEMFAAIEDMYPGTGEREAWRIVSRSDAYTGYKRRAEPEMRELSHEVERRCQKEGIDLKDII